MTLPNWSQIFTDPEYWRPAVERIYGEHGLGTPRELRTGIPGSCAVFLVDGTSVVKIYGPFWLDWFERELEVTRALEGRPGVLTPRVLASGRLDEPPLPYFVMTVLPGQAIGAVWEELTVEDRRDLAGQLGPLVRALHETPVENLRSAEPTAAAWLRQFQLQAARCADEHRRRGTLPPHLLEQVPAYVEAALPLVTAGFRPCLLSCDLTGDHVLVERREGRWRITGLIDFGDAEVGPAEYDFLVLGLDLLRGDQELLRTLLAAYGRTEAPRPSGEEAVEASRAPLFNTERLRRLRIYTLTHRFSDPLHNLKLQGKPTETATLEELLERLWPA